MGLFWSSNEEKIEELEERVAELEGGKNDIVGEVLEETLDTFVGIFTLGHYPKK